MPRSLFEIRIGVINVLYQNEVLRLEESYCDAISQVSLLLRVAPSERFLPSEASNHQRSVNIKSLFHHGHNEVTKRCRFLVLLNSYCRWLFAND
jgi:hypothetical protein